MPTDPRDARSCQHCGQRMKPRPLGRGGSPKRYCSRLCRQNAQWAARSGRFREERRVEWEAVQRRRDEDLCGKREAARRAKERAEHPWRYP
jgi:hypothetical protein